MDISILRGKTHTVHISSRPCMNWVDEKPPLSKSWKLLFSRHQKTAASFCRNECGHVCSMYRSIPLRSTLNTNITNVITGLDIDMRAVCTEAVHSAALEHNRYHRLGHVCSMYRNSPFRSTLNTDVITGLDMCAVCTEAVHCVALWTRTSRTLSQVWTCVLYAPKQSIPQPFEHERYHRLGHVCSMYRSSPFRSTLNTDVITGLDMCAVFTEAFHSVALWTRTLSQVWTCVQYVPKHSIP